MAVKKKKNKKKINLYILGSILTAAAFIAYGMVYIQSEISKNIIQTKIADLGEMQKSITKDVVIIRKNVKIISGKDGILTKFYNQGDRVPKDAVICKVQDSSSGENDIAILTRLNIQIDDMQNNNGNYSIETENRKLQNDINFLYMDIQEKIKNNDFKSIAKLKAELASLIGKKNVMEDTASYENADIQTLLNQKKELESKLASNNIYLRSAQSGVVSYYYDGFEDKFSFDNIKKITVDDINSTSNNVKEINGNFVKKEDLIGYVVDNRYYYLATEIEKSDIESIRRDVKLSVISGDITFNAYFYDFYKDTNGKFVGLFKVESEDYDFLKRRKDNVKIIYSYAKGIIIPNDSIIESNGKKGVYVVDEVGVAKFSKIGDILLSDDKNTIVRFSYDDFEEPSKMQLYDEIILSPKNIKDGQKVR